MIYFIQRADGTIKIGASEDFKRRLITLKCQFGAFKVVGIMEGDRQREQCLHRQFSHLNTGGDGKEWFRQSDELLQFISTNTEPCTPPVKRKARVKSARLVCDRRVATILRQFATGLGVPVEDAIMYLFREQVAPNEDPLLALSSALSSAIWLVSANA